MRYPLANVRRPIFPSLRGELVDNYTKSVDDFKTMLRKQEEEARQRYAKANPGPVYTPPKYPGSTFPTTPPPAVTPPMQTPIPISNPGSSVAMEPPPGPLWPPAGPSNPPGYDPDEPEPRPRDDSPPEDPDQIEVHRYSPPAPSGFGYGSPPSPPTSVTGGMISEPPNGPPPAPPVETPGGPHFYSPKEPPAGGCPSGTSFITGVGCVPDTASIPQRPPIRPPPEPDPGPRSGGFGPGSPPLPPRSVATGILTPRPEPGEMPPPLPIPYGPPPPSNPPTATGGGEGMACLSCGGSIRWGYPGPGCIGIPYDKETCQALSHGGIPSIPGGSGPVGMTPMNVAPSAGGYGGAMLRGRVRPRAVAVIGMRKGQRFS